VAARHLSDRVAHIHGWVVGRELARWEGCDGRPRLGHAIDPECAPIIAVEVVREQVPPPREDDESIRLDVALRCCTVARGVREREPYAVVAGTRNHVEDVGADRVRRRAPRREHGRAPKRVGALAQPRREEVQRLRERADRRLRHSCDLVVGRRVQAHDERDRFVVVEHERGEGRARSELVAATDAARGRDRISELAEAVDVAAQRAFGHAEAFGELGAGPVAARLEEREEGEDAGGGVGHDSRISPIADGTCPQ